MKKGRGWLIAYTLTIFCSLALVHWGNRAVTVISEHALLPRRQCIIIDPGHGGLDGGASSCTGKPESDYNLEISLKLRDLLHLLGYQTKMIRTQDESVYTSGKTIAAKKVSDLKQRVKMVNETPQGILISIHQNTYPDQRYWGAQVFYSETSGSKELAMRLQDALAKGLSPHSSRKCKKAEGIYLMEHIKSPGILIECGFISNPQDEKRLSDSEYQQKICSVIARALAQFLG